MKNIEIEKRVKEEVNKRFNCNNCCFKQDCEFMNGKNTAFDCMECPADEWADGYRRALYDTYDRLSQIPWDEAIKDITDYASDEPKTINPISFK